MGGEEKRREAGPRCRLPCGRRPLGRRRGWLVELEVAVAVGTRVRPCRPERDDVGAEIDFVSPLNHRFLNKWFLEWHISNESTMKLYLFL
jgi:hypothetical protein